MVVLITGASGQLGQSFQWIAPQFPEITFHFKDLDTLDITNSDNVFNTFNYVKPNFCINCAAYTAVDKAETDVNTSEFINVKGVEILANKCKDFDTILIHVSTDFIFDGSKDIPYLETDTANPIGVYGKTKLDGEIKLQEICEKYIIVRTSWVYSQFANNFLKTMLRLGAERLEISIVNDQTGTPTYAVDLAFAILKMLPNPKYGIYNFSNLGSCTWYEFAQKIFQLTNNKIVIHPILTSQYPTPAQRPKYSVLDKTKIIQTYNLKIANWEESLKVALNHLN